MAWATGDIAVHRLNMAEHLGRALTKEEVVHHINGDKDNNDIENLWLFPNNKAHEKWHEMDVDLDEER
jgi:hypothetical protein